MVSFGYFSSKEVNGCETKIPFCVDFRAFNQITQYDNYPLPVFEETVSTLHGSRCFSVIVLFSGFWQIQLADEDKMKTAFTVPSGSYNFYDCRRFI